MEDLVRVQVCISTQPYFTSYVLSESTPGQVYSVLRAMPGDPPEEYTCTCKGFIHRGRCKHQHQITMCEWRELVGPETQSEEEKSAHLCPRCGNDTLEELSLV